MISSLSWPEINLYRRVGHHNILDNDMTFVTEPDGYEKTILSDLQGAWGVFRASVVNASGFENWDNVLFHTDEAMSWETARNLDRMPPLVLIIRNLCTQGGAPEEVMENLEDINEILEKTLEAFPKPQA